MSVIKHFRCWDKSFPPFYILYTTGSDKGSWGNFQQICIKETLKLYLKERQKKKKVQDTRNKGEEKRKHR